MTWTKKVPKVDGWYWVALEIHADNGAVFIRPELTVAAQRSNGHWWICRTPSSRTDDEMARTDEGRFVSLFYGPIEPPPLPQPQQPPQ